jgi:hypothetical protein
MDNANASVSPVLLMGSGHHVACHFPIVVFEA